MPSRRYSTGILGFIVLAVLALGFIQALWKDSKAEDCEDKGGEWVARNPQFDPPTDYYCFMEPNPSP